jgi:membrane-bound inhibitor of C-type lysozyme
MRPLAVLELQMTGSRYLCERGVEVPVVYVTDSETEVAILLVEGRQISLYGEAVASGARYGWPSDGSNYVWLTNDSGGTLLWKDGTSGTEAPILAGCEAQ